MHEQVKAFAQDLLPKLVETRRHLHAHPELSFEEHETASYVEQRLRKIGLRPTRMTNTGVVAMIEGKQPGKTIALRADLDALPILEENEVDYASQNPGVMHACGHDVHTTSLLGTAEILTKLKEHWSGSVKLIFQPGEEKLPGGASLMIKDGVLENPRPESIFGQHVLPQLEVGKVGFRSGKYMASADELYFTVHGKGGHAALPQHNIDPILIASHIVVALQQVVSRRKSPLLPSVLTIGKIEGKGATNVTPDKVEMAGTFRAFDEDWRTEAHGHIERIATQVAEAMGGRCEVDIRKGYPFVHNDEALTDAARDHAIAYLGQENVVELDMRPTGEDFSYYSQAMPGTFYRLGVRNEAEGKGNPLHTPLFDVDERCLEVGSGLMAWLAINALKS